MAGKSLLELKDLLRYRKKERGSVTHIANRLGQSNLITPEWLILTAKDMMPKPEHVSFPKPPKAPGIPVPIITSQFYNVYILYNS
jgi:metastasis-associated protein MTA